MRRFKIKSMDEITDNEIEIRNVIEMIQQDGVLSYDPEDPFQPELAVDEILTVFYCMSGETLIENSDYFGWIPRDIIMFKEPYTGGINKRLISIIATELKSETNNECSHPKKYRNTVSMNLSFWVCPDCKKEVT